MFCQTSIRLNKYFTFSSSYWQDMVAAFPIKTASGTLILRSFRHKAEREIMRNIIKDDVETARMFFKGKWKGYKCTHAHIHIGNKLKRYFWF